MSKYIKTVPLSDIERVAIVRGNGRLAAQVKKDTGCDLCMNAGFYGGDGKPTHHLKADGKVLARSPWGCWGFAWNSGTDIRMEVMPAESKRSYIAGVELLSPMVSETGEIPYDRRGELGGIRGRTAIAHTGDKLILYCSGDSTKDAATLEGVQEELRRLGAESAIYVDGGGSSQCDFGGGATIYSARPVYSFLCVWLKKKEDKPMGKKFKVCLDPGHGVETAGKCAPDKSYYEHEFNLDMAKRQKAILERHGVEVIMTRTDTHDVSLEKRVQISNAAGVDLFVSDHSNASGDGKDWTSPDGYGIYTSAAGATANRNIAANKILARARAAGIKLWGGGLFHEPWYVCKNAVAPAVLIEHGFHTNKAETAKLKTDAYRQQLAVVDCKGILDYLGIQWQDEPIKEPGKPTDEPWYAEDQEWAVSLGLTDGTRPMDSCTRAEQWTMLHNLYKAIKAGK